MIIKTLEHTGQDPLFEEEEQKRKEALLAEARQLLRDIHELEQNARQHGLRASTREKLRFRISDLAERADGLIAEANRFDLSTQDGRDAVVPARVSLRSEALGDVSHKRIGGGALAVAERLADHDSGYETWDNTIGDYR